MFPDLYCRQRGAGLPVALFIITVLSLIVATMAQLQQGGAESVSLQIQSQRAFYAAESGAQVAVAQVLAGDCGDVTNQTFTLTGLSTCTATLSCAGPQTIDTNDDGDFNDIGEQVYTLTSTGSCGAGPDQAERVVEVRVR
jgi:MSHA biogenesis protein MshP